MHIYARTQGGQDLGEDVVHVTTYLRDVRRIDEQDVICLKSAKSVEGDLLEPSVKYLDASEVVIAHEPTQVLGAWIYECAGDSIVEKQLVGIKHNTRGVARPNLDDTPRPGVADHTVQEDRVRILIVHVLEEVAQVVTLFFRLEWQAVIVRLELVEHRELTVLVKRDAG